MMADCRQMTLNCNVLSYKGKAWEVFCVALAQYHKVMDPDEKGKTRRRRNRNRGAM